MDNQWAAEHLQTIRTLMERSALYRRALAPIMTFVGSLGIAAAIAGYFLKIQLGEAFSVYWMAVAVAAVFGTLFLVRRQAVKQGEVFWSPPTRRLAQAMLPAFLVGGSASALAAGDLGQLHVITISVLMIVWTLLYGLALHAAGFFMPRGIRLFSWWFIVAGTALMLLDFESFSGGKSVFAPNFFTAHVMTEDQGAFIEWHYSPHLIMGLLFGASHLAYGIYLYFTERKNAA